MMEFLILSSVVGLIIYGFQQFTDPGDRMAIKVRKDGSREYERVSAEPDTTLPIWIKILIFIIIASVLFMPLDFILNRS